MFDLSPLHHVLNWQVFYILYIYKHRQNITWTHRWACVHNNIFVSSK